MKNKKLLDFTGSKISNVKQINPLFSTCKVRIMYVGKNRNMSNIAKRTVEKALPSLIGVPIVGEFSMEAKDYKGHGGKIDLDSYDFIHTTKPYGYVPQDATFSWEEVKVKDGSIREYLTVDGCHLWTGRYPEAFSIVEQGKGQSMEIEVNDGAWNEKEETYDINDFTFSALCILGDEVEPAFEDSTITASFSLDSDMFKLEYAQMMQDAKSALLEKEGNKMLKDLLVKYSTTMEDLTAKGLKFEEISEDELEAKIQEVLAVEPEGADEPEQGTDEPEAGTEPEGANEPEQAPEGSDEPLAGVDLTGTPEQGEPEGTNANDDNELPVEPETVNTVDVEELEARIVELEGLVVELDSLREFKLNTLKADHQEKAQKLFSNFQLTEEDVKDIDIHAFSVEEIEDKCYAIIGRKMASKKNFSKQTKEEGSIHLPIGSEDHQEKTSNGRYGDLMEKYKDKE